ncbi:MAG TPA: hypothetical protein GX392_05605 [Clostridiales bacterium]|nr:hypothetical protein [Clostridiales bacterium]
MTIRDIIECIDGKILTSECDMEQNVEYGYACDLLSHVMAKCSPNSVWITVQTHLNVVAVASLVDIACIIIPESIDVEKETLDRAEKEGITIISTGLNTFEICGRLYDMGISPCP